MLSKTKLFLQSGHTVKQHAWAYTELLVGSVEQVFCTNVSVTRQAGEMPLQSKLALLTFVFPNTTHWNPKTCGMLKNKQVEKTQNMRSFVRLLC